MTGTRNARVGRNFMVGGGVDTHERATNAGSDHPPACSEPWERNLLHTFTELADHLAEIVASGTLEASSRSSIRDACFTLCAMTQIIDDFVHRGFFGVGAKVDLALKRPERLDRYLSFLPGPAAKTLRILLVHGVLRKTAGAVDLLASLGVRARVFLNERTLFDLADEMRAVATDLAPWIDDELEADGTTSGSGGSLEIPTSRLTSLARRLTTGRLPRSLGDRTLKIPSCFKDFDSRPEDCLELARRFAKGRKDRTAPITVLGIRTSGSYLAPIVAGCLRTLGFSDVMVGSIRQRVPLFRREKSFLARRGKAGRVLLVDDPPVTGSAQLLVARTLVGLGVPREHVGLLVFKEPSAPLFRTGESSSTAREILGFETVILSREEWAVRKRLQDFERWHGPKGAAGPLEVEDLVSPDGSYRTSRCHDKARMSEAQASDPGRPRFFAKGTGYGWFEDHVHQSLEAMQDFLPETTGSAPGVLVSRWIEGPTLADRSASRDGTLLRTVARYVAARKTRLPVATGYRGDLADRQTGWFTLAGCFAKSYSFLAPLAGSILRPGLARIATRAPRMVLDARMGPEEWIVPEGESAPVKVDSEEHDFDRMDLGLYDPAYDLAAFIVEHGLSANEEETLLREYRAATDDEAVADRIAAYKLMVGVSKLSEIHLLLARGGSISRGFEGNHDVRAVGREEAAVERHLESTANRLLARAVRADEASPPPEKLFAIDVDGVLEDATLGFNATTPFGASALRILKRHGYCPVLVTGRSLPEVDDRSSSYRLRAGIAEYGSVLRIEGEDPVSLLLPEEKDELDRLRERLEGEPDLVVDPAFSFSVRVFTYRKGWRGAPPRERIEAALEECGLTRIRLIEGDGQTDCVGASCNKGRALDLLRKRLGSVEVHAVGDTMEDVAMFEVADRAFAPNNVRGSAVAAFRSGSLQVARKRFQRGLLEVARVAAHGSARECRRCRLEAAPRSHAELVRQFGIRDRSRLRNVLGLIRPGLLRYFLLSE